MQAVGEASAIARYVEVGPTVFVDIGDTKVVGSIARRKQAACAELAIAPTRIRPLKKPCAPWELILRQC